jgi:drug/metabolite transporter (DMT)-like permease
VVLFAALLHASWNAAAHRITDRAAGFVLMNLAITVIGAAMVLLFAAPVAAAWPYLLGSVAVHVLYSVLLLRSYQLGDFSQMYPLARGTSPLVVALVSVLVIGQPLGAPEAIGVLVMSLGLVILVFGNGRVRAQRAAIVAAVLTGLSIAGYTLLDGLGVRHAHSTGGYIGWLFFVQGPVIALVIGARRPSEIVRACRRFWLPGLLSGAVSLAAYGIVIWAQTRGNLATVAALRETSILFGALIGLVLFKDPLGRRRTVGAGFVVLGVLLLTL